MAVKECFKDRYKVRLSQSGFHLLAAFGFEAVDGKLLREGSVDKRRIKIRGKVNGKGFRLTSGELIIPQTGRLGCGVEVSSPTRAKRLTFL